MARGRKVVGICHICGSHGRLSFEHVPPRAAFNDRPVLLAKFEDMLNAGWGEEPPTTVQQKGAGAYTLCESCNNSTGSWYGRHFVDWCHQGMSILARASGRPSLIYMQYVFPLSILKQIVAMFFSANGAQFHSKHQPLVRFVLNREENQLPARYRVYTYYNAEGRLRNLGVVARGSFSRGETHTFSEITFPPFGYVLTIDSGAPDDQLFDITDFRTYRYREFAVLNLRLPVLPTHSPIPGDYRTAERLERDMKTSGVTQQRGYT